MNTTLRHRSAAASALAAALILAGAAPARAQQAPKPAAEIQRMTALAGSFEGEASYTINGKTVRFTLHHTNRVIAGGFGLQCHEEADVPEMGRYEAENLFGWDVGSGKLHLFTVTSDPNTHDHAGRWSDATHARLRYEGIQDGKKLVEDIPMEVVSPNEYRFTSTMRVGGQVAGVFQATMKRIESVSSR